MFCYYCISIYNNWYKLEFNYFVNIAQQQFNVCALIGLEANYVIVVHAGLGICLHRLHQFTSMVDVMEWFVAIDLY